MSFGLTSAGFIAKRLTDIKTELQTFFRAAWGAGVNLAETTPEGSLIGLMANSFALLWELMQQIWTIISPDSATGEALDKICAINNVTRLAALPSSFTAANSNAAVITGTPGTLVPAGFTAAVTGRPAVQFVTREDYTVGLGGTVSVDMYCTAAGPTEVTAGTMVDMVSSVIGVDSITNPLDATLGRNTETDDALRIRRLQSLTRQGTATVEGIRALLIQTLNVVQANIYENVDDVVNGDGVPGHAFEAVVLGGADADIAAAIWKSKPAGIQAFGSTTVNVTDSQGFVQPVSFSRPQQVPIHVIAEISKNTDTAEGDIYPADGDAAVAAAILAYGNAVSQVGRDLFNSQFYTPINTVKGIKGIVLKWGTAPAPTSTANITIGNRQLATWDSTRITVVSA